MVVNLPNDAKDVATATLGNLLIAAVFRGALAHLEAADAGNADRIPQESERSMLTSEFLHSIEQNGLPVVRLLQKFKFLRVRRLHPFEGIGPDKEPHGRNRDRFRTDATRRRQAFADCVLEILFFEQPKS